MHPDQYVGTLMEHLDDCVCNIEYVRWRHRLIYMIMLGRIQANLIQRQSQDKLLSQYEVVCCRLWKRIA